MRAALSCASFAMTSALFFVTIAAHAESPEVVENASERPRIGGIEPPRLKVDSPARYPEQALSERVRDTVAVDLVLEVDVNGRVTTARITSPKGHGFDEAAASAASALVFEPATRRGTPTAAKIRFSYTFDPPPARVAGRVLRPPSDVGIEGAAVTVRDASGAAHLTTTDADGAFQVNDIVPGKVHVHVEARGRRTEDVDDELAPGEEGEIVLRLALTNDPPAAPADISHETLHPRIEEVRVRSEKPPREVTKRTLSREEIAHIPGTNGDAIRSIQNLPGIARPPPFGGALVVRGSAPQDTSYFVDGTNVPLVYHFGGLSSVLPTEVLDRIDFYPGNYGAQYGRGMGGAVDVGARGPKNDGKLHGMAQVDLIDARVVAERSLGKGWSFLVAGRRSYFDLWLGPILERSAGVSTAPRYYDYQVMLKKEFGPEHDLRFFFFGSDDRVDIFGSTGGELVLGGGVSSTVAFWRIQGRYQYRVDAKTRITAVAAVGEDRTSVAIGSNYLDYKTVPISARAEISHRIADPLTLIAGTDVIDTPYDVRLRVPRPSRPGVPESGLTVLPPMTTMSGVMYTPGAWALAEIVPFRGTRIVPGFRADYANQTKEWDLSPRIVVRQDLTRGRPRTTVKGGVGLYYQPPGFMEIDPTFGTPGLKSNRSVHYSLGMEQEVGAHVDVSVETFYKSLDRLVVQDLGNTGDGRVYGTEWLLRWKNDPKFFGWIAYTLMRSERRETEAQDLRLFGYDQTHILTAIVSRTFGNGWRVGGRFRLVSGDLYTPQYYGALDVDRASYLPVSSYPPDGQRLGAFHQLDVRLDKTWDLGVFKLTAYADIQNVYFHRSQEGVAYNFNYTKSAPVLGLPLLPILGVRGDL
jgi:TonB family protein